MSQPSVPAPHHRHLATLYEITRTLNSSLDLDEVLENVMDQVIQVTGAERGFLMLCNDADGALEFKVARGMDHSDIEAPEFQVSTTIVREVARTRVPLLTDNAQYDARFGGRSIIVLGLRSILCVPITARGRLSGLVYVDNRLQSGLFDEEHLALLAAFADQAGIAIENARLYQVAVEKGRMERELQLAYEIQRGLLPRSLPTIPGYEIAADWRSAREVAGDFYDCLRFDDDTLGVVVADVSDKGAPAALFMAMAHSLIRGTALSAREPEETLRQVNRVLLSEAESAMFVTVYYSILRRGGAVEGVNAGHNRPLLVRARQGTAELLPRGGRPLGWFADLPLSTVRYQLEPGDVLVFYTDGLIEAMDRSGDYYGEARLIETVLGAAHLPPQDIVQAISTSLLDFLVGAPMFDDTTLVVVRYVGEGGVWHPAA